MESLGHKELRTSFQVKEFPLQSYRGSEKAIVSLYSVSPIYRGRVYRGIGYIAVACWTPFFWRPRARYFSWNRGNTLDPIRGRQFFAKSAHRDSLCSRFAGDNFSRNQLWPTCQCGLEHMLCDGQPSSAEHWHLHCIAEKGPVNPVPM